MTSPARWTLPSRATVGLGVALTLLCALGAIALGQLQALRQANIRVGRTLEVLNAIEVVNRRLVDAETAQRGFLLTARPGYLEPWMQARESLLPGALAELERLVADRPPQRANLEALRPLMRAKLDELARTITLRQTEGLEASLAILESDTGKRMMDDIRRLLAAMKEEEQARLRARLATADARNDRVGWSLLGGSGLAFLLVGVCALALNGQDRRRLAVQGRLRESEERLRVTLRSIGDAVIATDPDGRVVFMNTVAELLTGWPNAEATGRPLHEVFVIANEETHQPVENPVARVLREGVTIGLANHNLLFARDGRAIPVDDSAAPIRDPGHTVMGVVLVFRDVTERRRFEEEHADAARLAAKRAEAERGAEALRESEERYRSLVAASSDIVWTAGPLGTFDEPQPGWEAYTGQRWPQDAGQGWAAAVHPDDRDRTIALWEAAQIARSVLEVDVRVWHARSADYRHCHARGVPLLGPDGALRQWVGMIQDVHASRQAEIEREELLRAAELARGEAEAANQAKDEFLSVLSHELRSPLQTMLTWVALLRADRRGAAQVQRALDALAQSLQAQEQLINDLLDVSRIVSGKLTVERAPFDLTTTAATAVDRIEPEAAAKGLTLERRGLDGARAASGDPARLTQALHNVLDNAIKFTPSGGGIVVEARSVGNAHEILVRDSGDGIAPALLPHVFDRFWQADSAKTRRHGGLGLGLAIARHVLEAQGGTLSAVSDGAGHGSTFILGVPAARTPLPPAAPSPTATPSLTGLRILVVEDDEAMSEALAALLEHRGATVTTAASVRTALAALADAAPDVVLSDIGMPGESGYSLIREIRNREAGTGVRVPALAMTGFASPEDRDEARTAGFDDHVPKPVDPDTLVARIRQITGGAR